MKQNISNTKQHQFKNTSIADLTKLIIANSEKMYASNDKEELPINLIQYIDKYFEIFKPTQKELRDIASFSVDEAYYQMTEMVKMDEYVITYFQTVLAYLFGQIRNNDIKVFYILDNGLSEDRFMQITDLFDYMGFDVIHPYNQDDIIIKPKILRSINRSLNNSNHILYVEKDNRVNYLQDIIDVALKSNYLVIFRNKIPSIQHLEFIA